MGWFSNFVSNVGSAIGSAAKAVVGGVVRGVSAAVDFVKECWNGTEKKAQETSVNIGSSRSYDYDNASMAETINVNNELNSFKNVASKEARKIEDMLVDECEEVFDKLMDSINEINERANLNIPLTMIRRDSKKLLKSIKGSIENDVITKISIDNATCKAILYLDAGANKTKQMKDFITNTSRDAIKRMRDSLNDTLQDNIDSIKDKIEMHIGNAESLHTRDSKVLNEIKNSKEGKEKEKMQLNIAFDMFEYANALDFIRNPLAKKGVKKGEEESLSYAFSQS
ncbi:hypothetical protein DCO58_05285 [Helicobacter saguini]|uniref:Uncharacterized protein n=1 Tax=Helicobacter saguini TaxID=1548018 RepID=A0A347VT50_9HELI|nr:hypothetical protein [Helicobacter saguini]MWV62237.1 hypothetical protein [Helicobacter saguini]MWV67090.1 hypothetical protein [Helicobacter saguini]MWV69440.1 hypothetical protein [Helicobacter saguini]MWV71007.1 hypothetical protein [Helicobacter saguini]TLD91758.1 hypothetical protein LS64_011405 [Helicobacter saguini]